MPHLAQSQSLAVQAVKNYKELLRKIAYQGHATCEGGAADTPAAAATYLPASAVSASATSSYILSEFEQHRVRVEASFERSFERLKQLAMMDASALRASYHASKQHAKERLREAINTNIAKYLAPQQQQQGRLQQPQLDAMMGARASEGTQQPAAHVQQQQQQPPAAAAALVPSELYGSYGFLRSAVLYLVGHASRAYMLSLNSTRVEGLEVVEQAMARPAGQPLITVSNHVAALDDPLVMAALLPPGALEQPQALRWTLCATDRCFKYAAAIPFFRAAKVLPVVRGAGMAQPGMLAAEERLAAGEWVHIFPEGTRSRDGKSLGPVRKGVGRLVASCPQLPLVVPFVHSGMETIMPRGSVVPAVGQQVHVVVGQPIPMADLLQRAQAEGWQEDRLHVAVASRVSTHLQALKQRLEGAGAGGPGADDGDVAAVAAAPGGAEGVSSLDLFDPQDVVPRGRGRISAAWERVKFRMQHRSWLLESGVPTPLPRQQQQPGAAAMMPAMTTAGPVSSRRWHGARPAAYFAS